MSVKVNDLLRQALELEPKAREELATLLLESLPTESPMEVEAAWEAAQAAHWPSTDDMTRDVYTTWPEGAR